jgi:hypothetical protein
MPSFLVTKHMSPALAARVLASVSGHHPGQPKAKLRPFKAVLRLVAFVVLAGAVAVVLDVRQQRALELEQQRAELLRSIESAGSGLSKSDRELAKRVDAAVAQHAVPAYAGDLISPSLRDDQQLAALLALPTLYLRGPLEMLARTGGVARAALSSFKDAFALCLVDPPEARTEKALLAKARAAERSAGAAELAHFERLEPLLQALPLLGPDWTHRVQTAESAATLAGYRKLFEVAPLRAAVRAAKARQLLLVLDEPGDAKVPAELDGERPHAVRVVISDLGSGELALRFRHEVDPSWLSAKARAEHASGIDSCALAVDLRRALGGNAQ